MQGGNLSPRENLSLVDTTLGIDVVYKIKYNLPTNVIGALKS
jgi:hypothetical protein